VGLADRSAGPASELSPGLARRLAFGRAILHHPAVLILVEPFAECDVASVELITRLINQLAADTAVLILALEATGFNQLCQKIYVVENGRISQAQTPEMQTQPDLPFKIPARLEGKVALINPGDILYASTEDGRTCLHTITDQIATHLTLSELEERLARSGFFRAHRSYLVNLQHVREVIAYTRDSYTLILGGAARVEIPLSKNAARDLRELLDY
jgi:ABC-2 type transport system ATP-binding protein